MTDLRSLHWTLIIGLGALALIRPLLRIASDQLGLPDGPLVPVAVTVGITAVWIGAVRIRRVTDPVLTLIVAGLCYGVFSIALSGVLSPLLDGTLEGPLANPVAIAPVLLLNAAWGAAAGLVAAGLQRVRAPR